RALPRPAGGEGQAGAGEEDGLADAVAGRAGRGLVRQPAAGDERLPVPAQGGEAGRVLPHLDGGPVAGGDPGRPEGAAAARPGPPEQPAQPGAPGQQAAKLFKRSLKSSSQRQRPDAAAVAEGARVQPAGADQLAGHAQQAGAGAVPGEDGRGGLALDELLEVEPGAGLVQLLKEPDADAPR